MMPVIFFGGTVIFFFLVKKDVDSCTARIQNYLCVLASQVLHCRLAVGDCGARHPAVNLRPDTHFIGSVTAAYLRCMQLQRNSRTCTTGTGRGDSCASWGSVKGLCSGSSSFSFCTAARRKSRTSICGIVKHVSHGRADQNSCNGGVLLSSFAGA